MVTYEDIYLEGYYDALNEMEELNDDYYDELNEELEEIWLEGYYAALMEAKKQNIGKKRNNKMTVEMNGHKQTIHIKPTKTKAITSPVPTKARIAMGDEKIHNKAENITYNAKRGDHILTDKKGNSYIAQKSVIDKNYKEGSRGISKDGTESIIHKKEQKKKSYMFPKGVTGLYAPWGKASVTANHVGVSHGDKNGFNDVSPVLRGAGNYKYLPKK